MIKLRIILIGFMKTVKNIENINKNINRKEQNLLKMQDGKFPAMASY